MGRTEVVLRPSRGLRTIFGPEYSMTVETIDCLTGTAHCLGTAWPSRVLTAWTGNDHHDTQLATKGRPFPDKSKEETSVLRTIKPERLDRRGNDRELGLALLLNTHLAKQYFPPHCGDCRAFNNTWGWPILRTCRGPYCARQSEGGRLNDSAERGRTSVPQAELSDSDPIRTVQ